MVFLTGTPCGARAEQDIAAIVSAENPAGEMAANDLANFFLKKSRYWPDGTPVKFIDHRAGTAERELFLRRVVHKSAHEVELYWIGQKLYSGDSAPIQASSDAVCSSLVGTFKGAVSYVSSDFVPGKGVKKIPITGAGAP